MMKLKAFLMVFMISLIVATVHLDIEDQVSHFLEMGENTIADGLTSAGISPNASDKIASISVKAVSFVLNIPWTLGQYAAAHSNFNIDNTQFGSRLASLR